MQDDRKNDGKSAATQTSRARATTERSGAASSEAARLARRVEVQKDIAKMSGRPLNNPLFTSTAVLIVAAVALAVIAAALYFVLLA